jgi:hypothetical protein
LGPWSFGVVPALQNPWWTTLPQDRVRRRRGPERGRLLTGLVVAVVLLVIAAIVLPFAANRAAPPPASPPRNPQFSAQQLARQLNLVQSDVPSDWVVDRSPDGPLNALLSSGSSAGAPSPQEQKPANNQVASQFEQCMRITAAQDRIFGSAGSKYSAASSSPAFESPNGGPDEEAGSSVEIFATSRLVADDVAQIAKSQFPSCFGTALAALFVGAAGNVPGGGQIGQIAVQPLTLPQRAGVTTSGVDVTIPVTRQGATVPIQYGVVLIGGGKAEGTLYTFSEPQSFPSSLDSTLTSGLVHNIVTESYGTAT